MQLREDVVAHISSPPGVTGNPETSIRTMKEIYNQDACHSLSI